MFATFCCNVTVRSVEILGFYNCFVDKECDQVIVLLSWIYINLCTTHFFDLFAKCENFTKNITSWKKVEEGVQSTAMTTSLKPALDFSSKQQIT